MKRFFVLLLSILLVGCAQVNEGKVSADLDSLFSKAQAYTLIRRNNFSHYYNYYLPSDINESLFDNNNCVFTYNDSTILMNLNIPGVLNTHYYEKYALKDEGYFSSEELIYEHEGKYLRSDNVYRDFFCKIYRQQDRYLIHFMSADLNFYSNATLADCYEVVRHILFIARSAEIDEESIVNDFSSKDVIDYQKKQIDLFDYIIPTNGQLSDLVDGPSRDLTEETEETETEGIEETEQQES